MDKGLAVIKSGGKQYLVEEGSCLLLEKLEGQPGAKTVFDEVLLLADKDGKVRLGTPFLNRSRVQAEIVEQVKGKKLLGIRYYQKKHMRKYGHRQQLTRVKILGIKTTGDKKVTTAKAK